MAGWAETGQLGPGNRGDFKGGPYSISGYGSTRGFGRWDFERIGISRTEEEIPGSRRRVSLFWPWPVPKPREANGEYTTRAVLDGDEWVINGTKLFITNIHYADIYIVVAAPSPDAPKTSHSLFLVPKETPGLELSKQNKLGGMGPAPEPFT